MLFKKCIASLRRINERSSGSTLVVVVVFMAVAAILLTATATTILSSNAVSQENVQANQAYFTARSAVNMMVSYLLNPTNAGDVDSILTGSAVTSPTWTQMKDASGNNMGDYKISIVPGTNVNGSQTETIKATAAYPDHNHGVVRTISRTLKKSSYAQQIYSNLAYINSTLPTTMGQCGVNGDITTDGSFTLQQGTTVTGSITTNGTMTVTGGATGTITALKAIGNLVINSGGTITNGDVYATGNVDMSGGGTIIGNLFANGSLSMHDGGHITKNVTVVGNVALDSGPTIDGNLTMGGTETITNSGKVVYGTITRNATVNPVSIQVPKPITQTVAIPSINDDPQLYQPMVFTDSNSAWAWSGTYDSATISHDCTFNPSDYSFKSEAQITVDTSTSDVSILITKNITNFPPITIKTNSNNHNLYIYLVNNASLSISGNTYIGSSDRKSSSQNVFIMGNGSSAVNFVSNSSINACVFLPNGSVYGSDSTYTESQKFRGSILAQSVNFNHLSTSNSIDYAQSPVESTPIGAALSDWVADKWSQDGFGS